LRRADRLLQIIQILRRSNGPTTAQALATELEVVPRTIYRDIAALQASRVPIDGEAGFGYMLRPGYDLPPLMFDTAEIEAVVPGLAMVVERGDEEMARGATDAMAKIRVVMPQDVADTAWKALLIVPHPMEKGVGFGSHISTIRAAIRSSRKLRIAYADENGQRSERTIWPLGLYLYAQPVSQFLKTHNGVDLVFTCAGIGVGGSFLDTSPEHFREVVDTNLMGTIWTGKAFLPAMVAAERGHFVTIASAAAFHGLPHLSGYAATKAGVVQLSETLRSELAPLGIDVTVKMTTFYTSNIADYTRGPKQEIEKARTLVQIAPWSSPEVADALLLAVQARRFYMVAPAQAKFLWRFKRFMPKFYLWLMPKLFPKLEGKLLAKAAARGVN
jgi:short-subunit dehydrogenase